MTASLCTDSAPAAPFSVGKAFVDLARLALTGRGQDVSRFLQQAARGLRGTDPDAAAAIVAVLRQNPTSRSPLAGGGFDVPIPVDLDSRMQLLKVVPTDAVVREPILDEATFASVEQLIAERLAESELLAADLVPARAALFVGAPGVGKTMAAGWVAARLGLPLVVVDLANIMSSLLGRTGSNLRHVLDYAKERPCVLLLDEIDAIAKRRNDDHDIGELKRVVTVLLQQIDDWPSSAGLLLAATNHPELLDPAVWRRFDVAVQFELPGVEARREAVRVYGAGALSESSIEVVAQSAQGWSINDIERHVLKLRRKAVLTRTSVDELAEQAVTANTSSVCVTGKSETTSNREIGRHE